MLEWARIQIEKFGLSENLSNSFECSFIQEKLRSKRRK